MLHVLISHAVHTGVRVEFDPTAYAVTEGVDESVTLSVVMSGRSAIPVTATVTIVSGTAESMGLWRCYCFPFMCDSESLLSPQ